ncbi:hypothetical protein GN244_ATG10061 [Phytophthora infestans]|uniref:Uncharacterized protein n=1 Tax=Phytophthora infestans TaxID=4787 RepID=A0A833TAZ2_PHYIN|nr:hypothetical protein GN244_ATG10061 [Phytophthora infestans]
MDETEKSLFERSKQPKLKERESAKKRQCDDKLTLIDKQLDNEAAGEISWPRASPAAARVGASEVRIRVSIKEESDRSAC